MRRLGLLPLVNTFATPSVGAGFHAGASMPMGSDSSHLIDWNGRLKLEECIRIVDATSLMRIKAGSHTFMAMADAYRIASKLDEEQAVTINVCCLVACSEIDVRYVVASF